MRKLKKGVSFLLLVILLLNILPLGLVAGALGTLSAGTVTRTSDMVATVTFTSSEAGTYYYAVAEDEAEEPTIDTTGAGTACDTSLQTISLTELTAGEKDIYIVVKDSEGNSSTALKMDIPAYDGTAPVLTAGTASRVSSGAATVTFTSDEAGTYYYTIAEDGATAPEASVVVSSGTSGSCVSDSNELSVTGLADSAAKDIYIAVKDAAGNVSNILQMDIAAYNDETAPELTAGAVSRISDSAATVKFTSDESGAYYYTVVADGITVDSIDTSGDGTACDTTEQTISLTDLDEGALDIYLAVKDAAGNVSELLQIDIPVYGDITAPVLTAGTASRTGGATATVTFTTDEAGTYYYIVVEDGAAEPDIDTDGAGTICAVGTQTIAITDISLDAQDVYIVVKDAAGNESALLKMDIAEMMKNIVQVSAGGTIAALDSDGQVWTWGSNTYRQLGNGSTVSYSVEPVKVTVPSGMGKIISIASGSYTMYALDENGKVWAWGRNNYGQLGNGTSSTSVYASIPAQVSIPSGMGQIVSITAYSLSAYAIDVNGTVCAWGLSSSGQCSTGNTSNVTTPVVITALTTPVAKLVFNGNTTYALDTSGYLWTWGYSNVGQLGNGGTDYVMTAARLTVTDPDDSTVTILFKDIAIESAAGLALDTTGRIWGWGTGGKIGDGTTTASYIPVRVKVMSGENEVFFSSIYAGSAAAYALTAGGVLYAWGGNTYGGIGDGTTTDATAPTLVTAFGEKTITSVRTYVGANSVYAIDEDENIWAWGYNNVGQLGLGSSAGTPVSTPTQVSSLSDVKSVAVYSSNGYVIGNDGCLWSAGAGSNGLLGNNGTVNSSEFVKIAGGTLSGNMDAPVLSSRAASRTGAGTATVTFQSSMAGTGYYTVLEDGQTAPSAEDLILSGTGKAVVKGTNTVTLTDLSAGTKDFYIVATAEGETSDVYLIEISAYDSDLPTLTTGTVTRSSDSAAVVTFTASEAGVYSYKVVSNGAAAPTASALISGGTSVAAVSGENTLTFTSLTAGEKDLYLVLKDSSGNVGEVLLIDIPLDNVPTVLVRGLGTRTSETEATVTFTADEAGTYYYVVYEDDATAPSDADILAGASAAMTAGVNTISLSGLTSGSKDVYVIVKDVQNNVSSAIKVEFSAYRVRTATKLTDVALVSGYLVYAVAVDEDGYLWHWGTSNTMGFKSLTPVALEQPAGMGSIVQIQVLENGCCALDENGVVWAWGVNDYGQLGNGTKTASAVPVQVNLSPASGIKQLVASISTAIYVLDNDGNIWSWGANYAGQMGNGGTTSVTTPAMLSVSDGDTAVYFTDVAASNFAAAYALDTDGNIWVWGYGANYSLGNNATANVLAPVKLTVTDDDGSAVTFTDVNAGRSGYATDTSGNVWAWGLNNYGWFGDGTTDTRTVPSKLTLPADTATIYYGPMNLFVTDTSGDVWVSGSNSGQLGTGNYVNSSVFIKHDQLSAMDIEFINLGDSCAYMVDSAGDLWTAGSNTYGAQGNNTKVNTKTFLQVTNVTAPTAPTNFTATAQTVEAGTSTVRLTWTPGEDALVHYIYKSTSEEGLATATARTIASDATYCNATGLTNGSTYYFAIEAVNAGGSSSMVYSGAVTTLTAEAAIADTISVSKIGAYSTGSSSKNGGVAEIVQYNADNGMYYVVDGYNGRLEIVPILDSDGNVISTSTNASTTTTLIDIKTLVETAVNGFTYLDFTSVAIDTVNDRVYCTIQPSGYIGARGIILVLDYDGNYITSYEAGYGPDMVTVSADGRYVFTADEGEPRAAAATDVSLDPPGSVTIVDTMGTTDLTDDTVTHVGFDDTTKIDDDVHIKGIETDSTTGLLIQRSKTDPYATNDLEPEYVTLSEDGLTAYVTLQEANAIATIDVATKTLVSVKSLGYKDLSLPENSLDLVQESTATISLENIPAYGMYMPDGAATYTVNGKTYVLTANEGDSAEFVSNETKIYSAINFSDSDVSSFFFDSGTVSATSGNFTDIYYTEIASDMGTENAYLFGARSFSIWDASTMAQVYDSGNDFEVITAQRMPSQFNISNDEYESKKLDRRSTKKGPEPEGVTVGAIGDKTYAFIGLERIGGVMTYDITDPENPVFVNYINTRIFDTSSNKYYDSAPEGLDFISAEDSPTGMPLLLVAYEVGGTVGVYEIDANPDIIKGSVSRTSATDATVTFTSSEAGQYYYAVVDDGATAPTIVTTDTGTACDTTMQTITLTDLSSAEAKDLYLVVKDSDGTLSTLVIDIPAYDITPPTLTAGSVSRTSSSGATVKFTSGEAGEYYYAVVDNGATAPTIDTTGTGTDCDTAAQTITLTGLSSSGAKDIYIAVKDAAGNVSTAIKIDIPAYSTSSGSDTSSGTSGGTTTDSTVETSTDGDTTTTGSTVTGSTDSSGKAAGSVDSDTADELVAGAKAAEEAGKKAVIKIKLETDSSATSAEVSIPKDSFSSLATGTSADLTVDTGIGAVTFDASAVDAINSAASGDINIRVAKADTSGLSDEVKNQIGDRPVYDFTVTSGGSTISSFGGGNASISLPYTPSSGEDPNAIVVYYISDSGELETVRGTYNASTGMVEFTTDHFSTYAIGYNKVTFNDVADSDWYEEAVTFIAARGITTGTSGGAFSPDLTLTRGQFIVMLMRAYGIEADTNPTDNFSDAGNTYYTNYLAAAKRLGITTGVGDNKFAPDSEISRQDMFTLLYRALNVLGELPEATTTKTTSDFSDAGLISSYAQDAMSTLVKAGIVSGSGGKLNPTGTTTRSEMAQVLYNLLSA